MREGYRAASTRENAVFNMLAAFAATFLGARTNTYAIRTKSGPFNNVVIVSDRPLATACSLGDLPTDLLNG